MIFSQINTDLTDNPLSKISAASELKSVFICVNLWIIIMSEPTTVSDIFRRALAIRQSNANASYKDIQSQLVTEFGGKPFPLTAFLTIPEYDNIAPEEDWTAGLPVVLRGIQTEDWKELTHGIIISLEQVENYPIQSGREDDPNKEWRNRHKGIAEAEEKNLSKWMPDELMAMAKKNVKT